MRSALFFGIVLALVFLFASPANALVAQPQYTLYFQSGWNLFSAPIYDGYKYSRIQSTDCEDERFFHYESDSTTSGKYAVAGNIRQGANMEIGKGFWYKARQACSATLTGSKFLSVDDDAFKIPLYAGWNQIGAPYKFTSFGDMSGDCVLIGGPYRYDTRQRSWIRDEGMRPGIGYFVRVSGYCTLEGDAIPTPPAATPWPTYYPTNYPTVNPTWIPGKTILIEEYFDLQCPFCKRAEDTMRQIDAEYGGRVTRVYKHFPLTQIHPNAQKAAEAVECAREQGRFTEYKDLLFLNSYALDVPSLKRYASQMGLNSALFDSCLDGGVMAGRVQSDFNEGTSRGVSGTPSFFINGQQLVGAQPFQTFKQVIDPMLYGYVRPSTYPTIAPTAWPTPTPTPIPTITPASSVTIEEFTDFQCPFCGRSQETMAQLESNYAGRVTRVFKHFPLTQIHPNAMTAAIASECARNQGKFGEYRDILFANQQSLSSGDLKNYAAGLGMDAAIFNQCLDGEQTRPIVERDMAEGTRRGISGTPTFYLNGYQIVGAQPYSVFEAVVKQILVA